MRICIFDGILETHLGSSLERSLLKFGHETLNTGKIGSGFKFPKNYEDISHLEATVQEVIRFNPEVVFVMRPASLPHKLLGKLKSAGVTMIAWFSDDPVLFDLSYGPILSEYDIVLHCGNERVLEFYEDYFGYPTGVNFPFWTDHIAFPKVWGDRVADTDLLFLGNVHDAVRRDRYFAMGSSDLRVRVHGNIGADYFGIGGGYLLTDSEVAEAASTALMALNIPQFFKDHRGLETWFPGLDQLGYFQFPSRVVQYMAMGLPTISAIPNEQMIESYPEMAVVGSMEEAFETARKWIQEGNLAERSAAVGRRFDKYFSADSRVMALEQLLLGDDSWRGLSLEERASWFTKFDATERKSEELPPSGKSEGISLGSSRVKVVSLNGGSGSLYTRSAAVTEALSNREDIALKTLSLEDNPSLLAAEPQKILQNALVVDQVLFNQIGEAKILLVVGASVAITQAGKELLNQKGIRTVLVADESIHAWTQLVRALQGFDFVMTPNYGLFKRAKSHGFQNVDFVPHFVRPSFMSALDRFDRREEVIRIRESSKKEEIQSPSIYNDAQFLDQTILDFEELKKLELDELAERLKCSLTLLTFGGSRAEPQLDPMCAYVASASSLAFMGRPASPDAAHPYEQICYTAHDPGELRTKLVRILSSGLSCRPGLDAAVDLVSSPRRFFDSLDRVLVRPGVASGGPAANVLTAGSTLALPIRWGGDQRGRSILLKIWTIGNVGELADWRYSIRISGKEEFSIVPTGFDELFIDEVSDPGKLSVEAEYSGRRLEMPTPLGLTVDICAYPSGEQVGNASTSRVYSTYV